MELNKQRSRKEKIKFLLDVQTGKIKLLEPIEDMIVKHNNECFSMRTGKVWFEEKKTLESEEKHHQSE